MRELFKKLGSPRLAIFLAILLLIISALGTLAVSGGDAAVQRDKYGDFLFHVFTFIGRIDLYHSYGFFGVLALMWFNLLACSLLRLGPAVRSLKAESRLSDVKALSGYQNRLTVSVAKGTSTTRLVQALATGGYRLAGRGKLLYARRGLFGRFGAYVTHLGLLTIMVGAMVGGLAGFRGYLELNEGEASQLCYREGTGEPIELGFSVKLNEFQVEFYADGRPKEYQSDLVISRGEENLVQKVIEVNDPLEFEGIVFYQSSYGERGGSYVLNVKDEAHNTIASLPAEPGSRAAGKELKGMVIEVAGYYADFMMNEGKPATRSHRPNNPAVQIHYTTAEGKAGHSWIFANYPDFGGHGGELPFEMHLERDKSAGYYSGMQVVRDPSVPLVYTGCVILVLGFFLSFYVPFRRIWVLQEGTKLTLIGASNARGSMEEIFKKIVSDIKGEK